jgi:hypothetical protein
MSTNSELRGDIEVEPYAPPAVEILGTIVEMTATVGRKPECVGPSTL